MECYEARREINTIQVPRSKMTLNLSRLCGLLEGNGKMNLDLTQVRIESFQGGPCYSRGVITVSPTIHPHMAQFHVKMCPT